MKIRKSRILSILIAVCAVFAFSCDMANSPGSYTLTTSTNPSGAGTITPSGGEYGANKQIDIEATPEEGYIFIEWQGDLEGTENPTTLTLDDNKQVQAVFAAREYPLNITIQGEGMVEEEVLSENTDLAYGTEVQLTAIPEEGWRFVRWEGDLEGSENPEVITVDEQNNVIAVFEPATFTLTVETDGEGVVHEEVEGAESEKSVPAARFNTPPKNLKRGNTNGPSFSKGYEEEKSADEEENNITAKAEFDTDYEAGTKVQLTAEAADGWQFIRWENDLDGSENPISIDITEDKLVTAVFMEESEEPGISVSTNQVTNITENSASSGGEINADEGVNVVARGVCFSTNPGPDTDDECTNNGSGDNSFNSNLTGLEASTTYYVRAYGIANGETTYGNERSFTTLDPAPEFYEIDISTSGQGDVTKNPDLDEYEEGTEVTLTANPDDNWEFVRWEGDLNGTESSVSVVVDEDKNITAVFEELEEEEEPEEEYSINIETEGEGSVAIDPDQDNYTAGTTFTLTANPAEGYDFVRWDGDLEGSDTPAEITMDSNKDIVAVFEEEATEEFTLTIPPQEGGTVIVDPEQPTYASEESVTLTAEANEGWQFIGWDGDLEGAENPATVVMDEDKEISAVFEEISTYIITTSVDGDGNGDIIIDPQQSTYAEGTEVTFTATPGENATFVRWEGDLQGTENPATDTIEADMNVTAVFEAATVSHNYINDVTPENVNASNANRTYPVIQANWDGPGGDKRWLGRNLGSTAPPQSIDDDDPNRAGWYFQFNRSQGYFEDDTTHESVPHFPPSDVGVPVQPEHDSDWITDDPCTISLGTDWRVPTVDEWRAVVEANAAEQLNLHYTGSISHNLGALFGLGVAGNYWTSTQVQQQSPYAYSVEYRDGDLSIRGDYDMETGLTVRCIED